MAQNVPTTFTERKHDSDEPGEDESFLRVRTAPLELLMCTLCGAVAACCWRECGAVLWALARHMSIDRVHDACCCLVVVWHALRGC